MRTVLLLCLAMSAIAGEKKPTPASPLDSWIAEARSRDAASVESSAGGSLWRPDAPLADLTRDPKAAHMDDLVTVLVFENASAVARGTTKTSRQSAAQYSAGAVFGPTKAAGPLSNMLSVGGGKTLDGEGATTRSATLTTTLSARVAGVLPNGYLVLEGSKTMTVNSEAQVVTIRGVARPIDVAPGNLIRSDRLGQLEVRINGKGVVGDAVRRPNFLYRLLLGLLPF
ncbi:MAG TPA: flagellar basal body L-ring protein FlgH [Bryobacteraceae bacterium]|nr:flagellar basal body L-ring protein FlgH [Bryobacteraceae bacterium]